MKPSQITAVILAIFLIAFIGIIMLYMSNSDSESAQRQQAFSDLGGDFTLTGPKGTVSLSDFKGKTIVAYFGFTRCPEVCPDSMATIARAFDKLTEKQLNKTQALLISIDPIHDTPEVLETYTARFHSHIMGLTGEESLVKSVEEQYAVYVKVNKASDAKQMDEVEHSSRYYIINQDGRLVDAMRHSTTPSELAARLKEVL